MHLLHNYWYIASASSRLRSKPLAVQVLDQNLVLFRDVSGQAHALLNRCCHRGTQLSLGTLTNGNLACGYHGWQFNGTGQCVHIPSLTSGCQVPKSFQVPAFLCREQDSYIWIWIGEPDFAPTQPPGIANFQQYHWYQGSVPMQCESIKAIENNLDWCHPYFTHPWTHGQFFATHYRGFKEQSYEMRIHASGLVVFAPATESESDPIPESPPIRIDFELPDRVRVEFAKPCHRIILMHFVPTGAFTCRLEWLVTKILPFGSHTAWSDQEPVIFKQDRLILESARSWYELEGDSFECSVEADACTLLARKIVDLAAHNRWETLRSSLPQRRVVRVRA